MYIGPWQEYRLAKIQDDAIQRLRLEWEAQLRGQLPPEEDDRIRELMQPLVAKLPSLLLAAKSRTSAGVKNGRLVGSRSGIQSEGGSRCSSRPASARSNASSASVRTRSTCSGVKKGDGGVQRHTMQGGASNQDTHEDTSARAPSRPPKPKKKGKKAPLTALELVQKRKKMFATWIMQASNGNCDAGGDEASVTSRETGPETKNAADNGTVTRLPLIQTAVLANAATLLGEDTKCNPSARLALPPLSKSTMSTDASLEARSSDRAAMSPRIPASSSSADIDLDESVDEEEVNNLLDWTDTLLSPQAMDSLCDFDD